MKAKRIYMSDSYVVDGIEATIKSAKIDESNNIVLNLDKTIFHPKGGGQGPDIGSIGDFDIIGTFYNKERDDINHYIKSNNLNPEDLIGKKLPLRVNVERRARSAALHTSGHLLVHIIESLIEKKGSLIPMKGQHEPNSSRVVFKISNGVDKAKIKEKLSLLLDQNKSDKILSDIKNKSIKILNPVKSRKIQIGDYREIGCGGTHLCNLDQIKTLKIRKVKIKKNELSISYDATPDMIKFKDTIKKKKLLINNMKKSKIKNKLF